jgi:hypothetical protein
MAAHEPEHSSGLRKSHSLSSKGRVAVDDQDVVPVVNGNTAGFPVRRAVQKTAHKPAPWKYLRTISTFALPRLLQLAYFQKREQRLERSQVPHLRRAVFARLRWDAVLSNSIYWCCFCFRSCSCSAVRTVGRWPWSGSRDSVPFRKTRGIAAKKPAESTALLPRLSPQKRGANLGHPA